MDDLVQRFLSPENSTHRKYEALRAHGAGASGRGRPALRLRDRHVAQPARALPRGPRGAVLPAGPAWQAPTGAGAGPRAHRGAAHRREPSAEEIANRLTARERLPVSGPLLGCCAARGCPSCGGVPPNSVPPASRRQPTGASSTSRRGGCAPTSAGCSCSLPTFPMGCSRATACPVAAPSPAGSAHAARPELWGIGRPSHVMPERRTGAVRRPNAVPKRSTLTEYTGRVDPRVCPALMDEWHVAVRGLGVALGGGRSFDLDFHTIPHHGHDALIEKHYVSKRSRRQKGILAFLVRDADARVFAWANATLRKGEHNDEILRFVENWRARTGAVPAELVFDSRLTTYANLARLDALGVAFVTLRRRSAAMVAELLATPPEPGADYPHQRRTPFPGEHGPAPGGRCARSPSARNSRLVAHQPDEGAGATAHRDARRMVIENTSGLLPHGRTVRSGADEGRHRYPAHPDGTAPTASQTVSHRVPKGRARQRQRSPPPRSWSASAGEPTTRSCSTPGRPAVARKPAQAAV